MYYGKITGFGKAHPAHRVHNDQLSEFLDTSDEWIYPRTGIHSRYISTDEQTSQLAARAAKEALANAGITAKEVDVIIVSTVTPDCASPSVACLVQDEIGADKAFAFDISAGCSGFVYALSTAEKFINTGSYEHILVIGAETMSKVMSWEDRSTCVLFGDAAGCVLYSKDTDRHLLAEDLHSSGFNGEYKRLVVQPKPLENPFIEKQTAGPNLTMDGRFVFDFALRYVPKSLRVTCENAGLAIDDIDWFVAHQANKRIIEGVAKKLKLKLDKFYINIEDYGNTSSATIPVALTEMWEKGIFSDGTIKTLALTGFGAGYTWGSCIIKI